MSKTWVNDVYATLAVDPERRDEILKRAEEQRRAASAAKAAGKLAKRSKMSRAVWSRGQSESSAAVQAQARRDMGSVQGVVAKAATSYAGRQQRVRDEESAYSSDSDVSDDERAQYDDYAALSVNVASADDGDAAVSELDRLVARLRVEPHDDVERAAQFELYEAYAKTVEVAREATLAYWRDAADSFPPTVRADVSRHVARLDSPAMLGVDFVDGEWIVAQMTRKVNANVVAIESLLARMKRVAESVERSLAADCPVCLDAFGVDDSPKRPFLLGCCHALCHQCWTEWSAVCAGRAPCPLCRRRRFEEVIVQLADAT